MSERKPEKNKPSTARALKKAWRRSKSELSLKQFALNEESVKDLAETWLYNKKANTSNPPKGIGRTRKKKKKA